MEGVSLAIFGKSYSTLFTEFAQVIGRGFDKDEDIPFFMK
jgi:hypothetical protein